MKEIKLCHAKEMEDETWPCVPFPTIRMILDPSKLDCHKETWIERRILTNMSREHIEGPALRLRR